MLFENSLEIEQRYVEETKIYPVMHTIVIRKALLEELFAPQTMVQAAV